jgi:DNA-binding NtrC family response regulator
VLDAATISKVLPRSVTPAFTSSTVHAQHHSHPDPLHNFVQPLAQTLAAAEARAIEQALLASAGNRSQAARLLGISRSVLYDKLAKLS